MNNNPRPQFRPSFRPPFQPSFGQIRPPMGRTMIESRVINKSIVQKLFLLCVDGSISSVKDYILKTGITINDMVDENGQSIIHIIIQNDNLNQGEKIELLTFLKGRGGIIESYDTNNNNYTPMHIASQKKLTKIVSLLIESGHNVNAIDSSNKTPIFYAITGVEEECPVKKVDYFIKQKNKLNLNLTVLSKLSDEIINILIQKDELNQFIKHIYETSNTYDQIFKSDIEELMKKNNEVISKILSENLADKIKDSKIKEIIINTKQNIIQLIRNKLIESTKPYPVGFVERGWTPDNSPQNSILQIKNISDFSNELANKLQIQTTELFDKMRKNTIQLNNNLVDTVIVNILSLDTIINDILYLGYLYDFMNNQSDFIKKSNQPMIGGYGINLNDNILSEIKKLKKIIEYTGPASYISSNINEKNDTSIDNPKFDIFNTNYKNNPIYKLNPDNYKDVKEKQNMLTIITYFENLLGQPISTNKKCTTIVNKWLKSISNPKVPTNDDIYNLIESESINRSEIEECLRSLKIPIPDPPKHFNLIKKYLALLDIKFDSRAKIFIEPTNTQINWIITKIFEEDNKVSVTVLDIIECIKYFHFNFNVKTSKYAKCTTDIKQWLNTIAIKNKPSIEEIINFSKGLKIDIAIIKECLKDYFNITIQPSPNDKCFSEVKTWIDYKIIDSKNPTIAELETFVKEIFTTKWITLLDVRTWLATIRDKNNISESDIYPFVNNRWITPKDVLNWLSPIPILDRNTISDNKINELIDINNIRNNIKECLTYMNIPVPLPNDKCERVRLWGEMLLRRNTPTENDINDLLKQGAITLDEIKNCFIYLNIPYPTPPNDKCLSIVRPWLKTLAVLNTPTHEEINRLITTETTAGRPITREEIYNCLGYFTIRIPPKPPQPNLNIVNYWLTYNVAVKLTPTFLEIINLERTKLITRKNIEECLKYLGITIPSTLNNITTDKIDKVIDWLTTNRITFPQIPTGPQQATFIGFGTPPAITQLELAEILIYLGITPPNVECQNVDLWLPTLHVPYNPTVAEYDAYIGSVVPAKNSADVDACLIYRNIPKPTGIVLIGGAVGGSKCEGIVENWLQYVVKNKDSPTYEEMIFLSNSKSISIDEIKQCLQTNPTPISIPSEPTDECKGKINTWYQDKKIKYSPTNIQIKEFISENPDNIECLKAYGIPIPDSLNTDTNSNLINIIGPYSYQSITKLTKIILSNLNNLLEQIENIFQEIFMSPYNIYKIYSEFIPQLQNYLLSYILNIYYLENQKSYLAIWKLNLESTLTELVNQFTLIGPIEIVDPSNNKKTYDGSLFYKQILANLQTVNLDFILDKIYTNVKDIYVLINELIINLNTQNAHRIIDSYYNNFVDFNTLFNRGPITFTNLFKYVLSKIKDIPATYSEFKKLIAPDLDQTKKNIVETYFIQYTMYDYNVFLNNTSPQNPPKIGYNFGPIVYAIPVPSLLYGNKREINGDNLAEADANNKGELGMQPNKDMQKSEAVPSSINGYIDQHFTLLKYFLIRKIIDFISQLISTPNVDPVDPVAPLQILCKKFSLDIRTKLNIKDGTNNGVFYTIIATIVDKILIQNIFNALQIGINNFSYDKINSKRVDLIRKSLLKIRNIGDDKVVPVNYNDAIRLELPNLETDILTIFLNSRKAYAVSYAENVETRIRSNLFKVYAQGIFSHNNVARCFKFDYELIKELIKNRANLYAVDTDGSTPFFYSIETNNSELVRQMHMLMPPKFITYKNLFGLSPYDVAVGQLLSHVKSFDLDLMDDIISSVNKDISKKTTNPSPMRYQNELFMMFICVINYLFFMQSYEYSGGWTFDDKNKLDEVLSNPNPKLFPFDTILEQLKMTGDYTYISSVVDEESNTKNLNDAYINNDAKLSSLNAELTSTNIDPLRKSIVEKLILKSKSLNNSIQTDIGKNLNKIKSVTDELDSSSNKVVKPIIDRNPNLIPSSDPVEILDSFFEIVLNGKPSNTIKKDLFANTERKYVDMWKNYVAKSKFKSYETDYKTYMEIWKIYIKSHLNSPQNQIILIMNKIKSIFVPTSSNNLTKEPIKILARYCDKIIQPFCLNYTELDVEYNGSNYALNHVLRIIKHCVRHTMVVNLFNLIQKILRQEITTNNSKKEELYERELKGIFETAILDNISFTDYLFDTFIDKIIKNVLNIYESDTDPDRLVGLKDILQYLNKFLINNKITGIDEKSQSIALLNEKIYPYFETYFEINIRKLKELADAYVHTLLGFTESIKIVNIVNIVNIVQK